MNRFSALFPGCKCQPGLFGKRRDHARLHGIEHLDHYRRHIDVVMNTYRLAVDESVARDQTFVY